MEEKERKAQEEFFEALRSRGAEVEREEEREEVPEHHFAYNQESDSWNELQDSSDIPAEYESKHDICFWLHYVLMRTRHFSNLVNLLYDPKTETVEAIFTDRKSKKANVAGDSGIAMICDIIKQLQ